MARRPLFERLPQIWGRLDVNGTLERYLDIWDIELDWIKALTDDLLVTRDIDNTPDKYIALLSSLVGHSWRNDRSYQWNRRRAKHAIRRYSYKGTVTRLSDDLRDVGIPTGEWDITDMASKLLVWSRQGLWGTGNAYFTTADYYHDGAFDLAVIVTPGDDLSSFIEEFEDTRQAGTVWWYKARNRIAPSDSIFEAVWTWKHSPTLRSYDIDRLHYAAIGEWGGTSWSYEGQMQPYQRITEFRLEIMEAPISADSQLLVENEIPVGYVCPAEFAPLQLNPAITYYEV